MNNTLFLPKITVYGSSAILSNSGALGPGPCGGPLKLSVRESKTFIGSTHKAEQVLFSMFPSILSFNFDTILFFTY